jgi:transketolase
MLEDIGLMRMLPHMTVINPADAEEARKAVIAAATHPGPVYIRFGRSPVPLFTTQNTAYTIGKSVKLWEGEQPKVAILTNGPVTYNALLAARALESEGISSLVLSVSTVKPLDTEAVLDAAKRTGRVITVEEHQTMGGFGSAVAEFLSDAYPVPVKRLGIDDQFGQSGEPDQLIEHYGLGAAHIAEVARQMCTGGSA